MPPVQPFAHHEEGEAHEEHEEHPRLRLLGRAPTKDDQPAESPCHGPVPYSQGSEHRPNRTGERMSTDTETFKDEHSCGISDLRAFCLRIPPAPRRLGDGSVIPLSRSAMPPYTDSAAAVVVHAMPRGVYSEPYGTGRVYFTVQSNGVRGTWRLPLANETEDDVIVALGDALDANDPPQPSSALRRLLGVRAAARVLHLHLLSAAALSLV